MMPTSTVEQPQDDRVAKNVGRGIFAHCVGLPWTCHGSDSPSWRVFFGGVHCYCPIVFTYGCNNPSATADAWMLRETSRLQYFNIDEQMKPLHKKSTMFHREEPLKPREQEFDGAPNRISSKERNVEPFKSEGLE